MHGRASRVPARRRVIDRDTPPILREHRSAWPLLLPAAMLLCLLCTATGLRPALVSQGFGTTPSTVIAAATATTAVAALAYLVRWGWSTHLAEPGPPGSLWMRIAVGLVVGITAMGLMTPTTLSDRASRDVGLVAMAATIVLVRRRALAQRRSRTHRLRLLRHPVQAQELVDELGEELLDPAMSKRARIKVELAIAEGLSELVALGDRFDKLPEIREILERGLGSGHPAWEVKVAWSYVLVTTLDARRGGDPHEIEAALDLLDQAIAGAPPLLPRARCLILSARATALLLLHDDAQSDGEPERADRHRTDAIASLRQARALAPRSSADRHRLAIELASITATTPDDGGLDASIQRCRRSLRCLRAWPMREREDGCLKLVDLLCDRWESNGADARADLVEALRLCELTASKARDPGHALYRAAVLLNLLDADEAQISRAFRRAFAAFSTSSFADAVELAADWSRWAVARGHVADIAEAHWCRIRMLANESRRRRLHVAHAREPTEILKPAADAAFWLLAAERPRDAALALDLGVAVGLSERMHRGGEELDRRLYAAGRPDLADHWRDLTDRQSDARRGAAKSVLPAREATTIKVGRQRFRARASWRDYEGLADHDRLVREIGRLPGFEDVQAAATYEDLREAARDGPLVYLAATDDGAFAAIVSGESPEPDVVSLPALTSGEVLRRATRLTRAHGPAAFARDLDQVLEWLWTHLLKPLAPSLPADALVTLLPIGALGVLPIHAAAIRHRPDDAGQARAAGLAFRYAPTARALLRSQATAHGSGGPELALLTVSVPRAPTAGPLPQAPVESRGVAAVFPDDLVHRAPSASVDDVLGCLGDAAIWHLACRAEHDPAEPLASCLRLADGPLTLGAILEHECGRPRLAALSTWRAASTDGARLGDGWSLPSALLEVGVAGVVSSFALVDQRAAALLVVRFFERFLDGIDPARALADAQAWLAGATNREIGETFRALHPPPAHRSLELRERWARERPFADPACWAVFSYSGA